MRSTKCEYQSSLPLGRVSATALAVLVLITGVRSAFGQGMLTNGAEAVGTIGSPGQTQTWMFTAAQGDGLVLSVTDSAADPAWFPFAVLRAPDGTSLGGFGGADVGQTRQTAPQTGTYSVVVSTNPNVPNGTGPYILRLAKAPGSYTMPSGDQGGDLTNGQDHPGTITLGDLDLWSFHAEAGDALLLTVADQTGSLAPYIEVWGPNGASVANGDLGLATQLAFTAPAEMSGTYTVLISANVNAPASSGNYILRLARAPAPFEVPAGDQGGDLTDGQTYPGTITRGDLDLWRFYALAGDALSLTGTTVSGAAPWMRIWGPNGGPNLAFIGNGQAVQQLNFTAPLDGIYTVVISASINVPAGAGEYTLLATGVRPVPSQPIIGTVSGVTGTVTDGGKRLVNGDSVRQNDVIETDRWSQITITFIDGTELKLGQNAILQLDEYAYDPGTNEGHSSFSWLRGIFVWTSGLMKHSEPNRIETGYGCICIRGTQFIARYLYAADGVTLTNVEVDLVEGVVDIAPKQTSTTASFSGPVTIVFDGSGVTTSPLTDDAYNVIKTQLFPPPQVNISFTAAPAGQGGFFKAGQTPVSGTVSASDAWNVTSISCLDTLNGLTALGLVGGGTPSASRALTVSGDGIHPVTCMATNAAGNTGAAAGSANMATVKIDTTPPTVTYSGNLGTYTTSETVNITCAATDALSGWATTTCQDIIGPASSFNRGVNVFSASATDLAGNTGTGSTSFIVVGLQSLTISPVKPSVYAGSSLQFVATGHYSDGSTRDLTAAAVWSSSKTAVATISSSGGLANGTSKGTTTINAVAEGFSASTTLTVQTVALQSITITPNTATIAVGGSQQFRAMGRYNDGSTQDVSDVVSWSSSPNHLVSVTNTGLVTGLKPGTATIKAASQGVKASATLIVH